MADDFTNNDLTTGIIAVGGTVTGEIEAIFDRDWFAVTLISGHLYDIELRGVDTADGTLVDPLFAGIYYFDSISSGSSNNDANGVTTNSAVTYYAPYSGVYYLSAGGLGSIAGGLGSGVGTYTLSIVDLVDSTTGTPPNDRIVGNDGAETLQGNAGDDTILGLAGDDSLEGGDGADSIVGGFGADTIWGGDGNDTIIGTNGREPAYNGPTRGVGEADPSITDVIYGGDGDDQINTLGNLPPGNNSISFGGAGEDAIRGRGLVQFIDGGTDADFMSGDGGVTTYVVDNIGDVVKEYSYDSVDADGRAMGDIDEIRSKITWTMDEWDLFGGEFQVENLTLLDLNDSGQDGDDASDNVAVDIDGTGNEVGNVIKGNSGNNRLDGKEGPDTILGGAGIDTIIGGVGGDLLTGGTGADVFVFAPGDGNDTISDFVFGVDTFDLSAFGGSPTQVKTAAGNGDRIITVNGDVTIQLSGVPLNYAPEITSPEPGGATEEVLFSFTVTATDLDGDTIVYDAGGSTLPAWLTHQGGLTFSGTPDQADVGTTSITIAVSDGQGGTDTQTFDLTVADVNDAPTVALSGPTTGLAENTDTTGRLKVADIVVTDDVPGTNTLALTGADASLFEIDGTELYLRAGTVLNFATNPVLDVTVTVDDPTLGGTPDDSAALSIAVTDVNDAPTVALLGPTTGLAENTDTTGRLKVADIVVTDDVPGTNALALTGADAALFEIDGTELFLRAGTVLNFATNPALDVTVTVDDPTLGGTPDDSTALSIAVTDVNDAPTITSIAPLAATEDASFSYQITTTDEDGDVVRVDELLTTMPSWVSFNALTRTFSGTPLQVDVDVMNGDFSIVVTDDNGGTDTQAFSLMVNNVNDDPEIVSTEISTIDVNTLYTYQLVTEDEDGHIVTVDLLASTLPSWMIYNPVSNTFTGTPLAVDLGIIGNDVIVVVRDPLGATDTQTFTVNVIGPNAEPTGAVTIDGTPDIGFTVLANTSLLADANGLGPFSYQWRVDGQDLTSPDATTQSLLLTRDSQGQLTVVVSYTDLAGNNETVTSAEVFFGGQVFSGTADDDPLQGKNTDDTLIGLAGDDTLNGGSNSDGIDRLEGGPGDDIYEVFNMQEQVVELPGEGDLDQVLSTVSFTLPDNVEHLELLGTANLNGTGNALGNVIEGNAGDNDLSGLDGADTLWGRGGADTLLGGDGDDVYLVDDLNETLIEFSDQGDDTVLSTVSYFLDANFENLELLGNDDAIGQGNLGNNRISGNDARNVLIGGGGDDLLYGNGGDDFLIDGDGEDILVGGAGNDIYIIGETGDRVFELAGGGEDTVFFHGSEFTLPDNVENLVLSPIAPLLLQLYQNTDPADVVDDPLINPGTSTGDFASVFSFEHFYAAEQANYFQFEAEATGTGNALDNEILGDDGDNTLDGAAGDDVIQGGQGIDLMTGGSGRDVFVFTSWNDGGNAGFLELDVILDFEAGLDKIDLSNLQVSAGNAANNSLVAGIEELSLRFVDPSKTPFDTGDVAITDNGDGLFLVNVQNNNNNQKNLLFLVLSEAGLSESDFILDPRQADNTIVLADFIDDFSFSETSTTNVVIGESVDFFTGTSFGFGDQFTIRADYDLGEGLGISGSYGSAVTQPTNFENPDGSIILFRTNLSFSSVLFENDEPGPATDLTVLHLDRDLDSTADFTLQLEGDYRGATFRQEIVNGDIRISLFEGNTAPTGGIRIEGTPRVFELLQINTDNLFDREGIDLSTVEIQWFRKGVAIAGETGETYRSGLSDIGEVLTVQIKYVDGGGTEETVTSPPALPIIIDNLPALGDLKMSGSFIEGETVMVDAGGVIDINIPNPATAVYQWRRDGVDITGATAFTYELSQHDVGARISVHFNFDDFYGNAESKTSDPSEIVENVNDLPTGAVTISGGTAQGDVLTADFSGVLDADGLSNIEGTATFQWKRDGIDLPGATESTYTTRSFDAEQAITVALSYVDDQGTAEIIESAPLFITVPGIFRQGTSEPDILVGDGGPDTIIGLAGNDTIAGFAGDDILDGGTGIDTAVFAGNQASYTLTLSPTATTLTDRTANGEGTDQLTSIEFLDFGTEVPLFEGNPMNLDIFDGPTGLSAEEFGAIIELYIAYYNRAPDALGLFYWGTEFSNGFSLPRMAENFYGQPETQATYASVLTEQGELDTSDPQKVVAFVTEVYRNVLGRDPDLDGLNYWIGELQNNPFITPDVFILAIINGAKNPGTPTAQTALDQEYLATKADLGAYFAVIKGMSDIDDATAALALFDGTEASRDATIAAMDGHYTDALDPDTGDFLMPLVGVIDDPFAVI